MKRVLILVAILAAGLSGQAFARLGNSEEQVAALLGKPTEIGKPDSDGRIPMRAATTSPWSNS
jgi:hypothetical protein